MAGISIPDVFRRRVTERIRTVMRDAARSEGTWIASRELARYVGVSPVAAWYWWEGRHLPTLHHLVRMADYYEVSVDYLLGRTGAKALKVELERVKMHA